MTQRENQHGIARLLEAVQRHISRLAARYDEFAQIRINQAPHEWMVLQNGNGFFDQIDDIERACRVTFKQKVDEAFEIVQRPPRIDQLRQDLAFGRVLLEPATRSRR